MVLLRSRIGVGLIVAIVLSAAAVAVVAFVDRQQPMPTIQINSWAAWEKAMAQNIRGPNAGNMPDFGIMGTDAFRAVLATDDSSLWLDMINQPQYPLVVVSGYLCIEKKCPELSFRSALYTILHRPTGAAIDVFFPTIVSRIKHAELSAPNFATFSEVAASISDEREARNFIAWGVGAVPLDFLYKWFHDTASDSASASTKAMALDRLYASSNSEYPVSSRMSTSLDALGGLPGRPRLIWLIHTASHNDRFEKRFSQALEDESLDVTAILVEYREYVRKHHDELTKLKLSEPRRKLLDDAINLPEKR